MIKKTTSARKDRKLSRQTEYLVDTIRKFFVLKAAEIAQTEKAEDMLKMIMRSDTGESSSSNQKELWQLLEKVRREVLGDSVSTGKTASRKRKSAGRKICRKAGK